MMSGTQDRPKTFQDGYIDGYQSGAQTNATPSIPSYSIPAGRKPYDVGYERGYKRGVEVRTGKPAS